jgi:hypothetical protein
MAKARISANRPRTVGADCEDCEWSDCEFSGRRTGARHAATTGRTVMVVQETLITYNPRQQVTRWGCLRPGSREQIIATASRALAETS